jgi:NTP pyrophosphatase (non-canonical NTP hydrolase)
MIESLEDLRERLRAFVRERDWDQFHRPKNLTMALVVEAAELMEHFQWLSLDQPLEEETFREVREEVADVFIYLVRLADELGIDLLAAAADKIEVNARKYPADRVRGSAKKYDRY